MKQKGSVSWFSVHLLRFGLTFCAGRLVFRVAHDSAKEMRIWSGEVKKK